jgi:hypothetical protein
MDIDRSEEYIYYAFEWDNGANQDVILLSTELVNVGNVEPGGWGDGLGEGRKYAVEGTANAVNPAIAAEGGYVYLIVQTDEGGDQDIVCYYSSDNGETYDMSIIAESVSDETFPAIYANGETAYCVFTKDNDLYVAVTIDGGVNWEIMPDPINDVAGSVVSEYKCADVFEGNTIWSDSRNDDGDVYFDVFIAEPAISCVGDLSWTDVPAGGAVTGTFDVCNNGQPGSLLNWELAVTPSWGVWELVPESGTGLAEGDCVTITVTVTAPTDQNTEFFGEIKMINSDDPSDFCEVDIYLKTPKAKALQSTFVLQLFERFPNMFPILRHIFGL